MNTKLGGETLAFQSVLKQKKYYFQIFKMHCLKKKTKTPLKYIRTVTFYTSLSCYCLLPHYTLKLLNV